MAKEMLERISAYETLRQKFYAPEKPYKTGHVNKTKHP